jgi:hypothetical protein
MLIHGRGTARVLGDTTFKYLYSCRSIMTLERAAFLTTGPTQYSYKVLPSSMNMLGMT